MANILDDAVTKTEILTHFLFIIDNLMEITDEMNDAEIDVRTTLAQIRGITDVTLGLIGVEIKYERDSDIN